MKSIFKAVTAVAVFGASLTGCAVYAPPVDVGVGVSYGPRYGYVERAPVVVVPRYGHYPHAGRGYYGGRGYYRHRHRH